MSKTDSQDAAFNVVEFIKKEVSKCLLDFYVGGKVCASCLEYTFSVTFGRVSCIAYCPEP
jgi:hypothetical protein